MTHNVTQIQQRLIALGYLRPGEDDGKFGPKSLDAYNHWRASKGAAPVNAASLSQLDRDLFPEDYPNPKGTIMNTVIQSIGATASDYFLNFITSKINWAAAAMVGFLVTFVGTKFGFTISPEMAQWMTVEIAAVFGAIIMWLRTFKNSPRVVNAVPLVITTQGAEKKV